MNNIKIVNIVQQLALSLDIKLHEKDNSSSTLRFEGRTKGIEVFYISAHKQEIKVKYKPISVLAPLDIIMSLDFLKKLLLAILNLNI